MEETSKPQHHPEEKPSSPVMDIVPPKPAEAPKAPFKPEETPTPAHHKAPETQAIRPPKDQRSGVGLAIVATIIIVLGLAALFVYAYLRTKNVSLY